VRRTRPAALLLVAAFGCGGPADRPLAQTPTAGVTLAEVSVAGLEAAVAEQKGKVVLLDVWFLG
jgi:hypothetical protein